MDESVWRESVVRLSISCCCLLLQWSWYVSHLVYFTKKFYTVCNINVICKDNVAVNYVSVQHKWMLILVNFKWPFCATQYYHCSSYNEGEYAVSLILIKKHYFKIHWMCIKSTSLFYSHLLENNIPWKSICLMEDYSNVYRYSLNFQLLFNYII